MCASVVLCPSEGQVILVSRDVEVDGVVGKLLRVVRERKLWLEARTYVPSFRATCKSGSSRTTRADASVACTLRAVVTAQWI
jgi:hypothetical protein